MVTSEEWNKFFIFIMFEDHFREDMPIDVLRAITSGDFDSKREKLLASQKRSRFSMDGKILPISFFPRVLTRSYNKTIEDVCRRFTEDFLSRLYNPDRVPSDLTMFRMLLKDGAIECLPDKLVGGMRYDLALVGRPKHDNPPHVLEVNVLNYHGVGWVPLVRDIYFSAFPELSDILEAHDMNSALAENFSRMGKSFVMVVEDDPGYEDSSVFRRSMRRYGIDIRAMSDEEFTRRLSDRTLKLSPEGVKVDEKHYDAVYLRAFCDTRQIMRYRSAVREIIRSHVPTYDYLGGLLLEDKLLVSMALDEPMRKKLKTDPSGRVLKKRIGSCGASVYVGEEIKDLINDDIAPRNWCVQEMLKLNTMLTYPSDGVGKLGIVDIGCYVTYSFIKGEGLKDFKVAGIMVRSSQNSYKVNISNGGCFVPVFYRK